MCHVYLSNQLLRMPDVFALIERRGVLFLPGIVQRIIATLSRYAADLKCSLRPHFNFLLQPELG